MKAIGIILAGGTNNKLGALVRSRTNSALPVACSFRAIDFSLSNMSNSGINKIAVVTQYNSRSLSDHISSSKWWNIGRKNSGIFVFTPYASDQNQPWYRGTADSIYQNLSYLEKSHEDYVVIANGDGVYKMDYSDLIKDHIATGADVTIVCKEFNNDEIDHRNFGNAVVDEYGRIIDFEEKPLEKMSNTVSIGVYVIKRTLLIELVTTAISSGRYDFVNDIIVRYRNKLKFYAYNFNGYWKPLNSIKNYFDVNNKFLDGTFRYEMLNSYPYIMTKSKDEPPAKYNYNANVKNSIVGNGSIVSGTLENSTLFRGVRIGDNSTIKNCIIFEGAEIGDNCHLEYVILDKRVKVNSGVSIIGNIDKIKIYEKNFVIE
ncbi:MAG: glucose-1-phosphate adenylyltransferase subunit GlgD [Lachnospirales bacterium]